MSARKIRVDISDKEGNKFTVTFQGKVTRKKILQLLDLVEILGGVSPSSDVNESFSNQSKFAKISNLIKKHFPIGWFSSKDLKSVYEDVYGESVGLSTVSTYLSRLTHRGVLHKSGSSQKQYRLRQESTLSSSVRILQ